MERSLISERAGEDGLSLLDIDDVKAIKPVLPVLVQMPLDANLIPFLNHLLLTFFFLISFSIESVNLHLYFDHATKDGFTGVL